MNVSLVTGSKRHELKARKDDLYETPPEAVEALLRAEPIPLRVWEPACGPGAIARVLRSNGRNVFASDLVDYKSADQDQTGWDFLLEQRSIHGFDAIVTNPPYKLASQFVRQAIKLKIQYVAMLLRLAFLEGSGRSDILDGPLSRVHVFKNRLPMMHRDGWEGKRSTSAIPFAWFIWDRSDGYDGSIRGPAILRRISWASPASGGQAHQPARLK